MRDAETVIYSRSSSGMIRIDGDWRPIKDIMKRIHLHLEPEELARQLLPQGYYLVKRFNCGKIDQNVANQGNIVMNIRMQETPDATPETAPENEPVEPQNVESEEETPAE